MSFGFLGLLDEVYFCQDGFLACAVYLYDTVEADNTLFEQYQVQRTCRIFHPKLDDVLFRRVGLTVLDFPGGDKRVASIPKYDCQPFELGVHLG